VGANAFGQREETFADQVEERFDKAEIAQIMRHNGQIVGFALHGIIRSYLWRFADN
jgi:hypothetical protein